jgi:hypothetical protein
MVRFGEARVNVVWMYYILTRKKGVSKWVGEGLGRERGGEKYVVDKLLDAVAQLVFLAVCCAVDCREGGVDAVCGCTAHIFDQVGQVLGGLELDVPVGSLVHLVLSFGRVRAGMMRLIGIGVRG